VAAATLKAGECRRISRCALAVEARRWDYALRHKVAIAAHWQKARITRPKLFDGTIYLMSNYSLDESALAGALFPVDFKSFLYWREQGFPECGVRDAFGASVIRSREGYVLLGRQSEGNLNAGLAYPPCGMIDGDDVRGGAIDIDANIARELNEETGLAADELTRMPGFVVLSLPPLLAIAIEWRSSLPADALRERILEHVRSEPEPELADVVIVRSPADLEHLNVPDYAVQLLRMMMTA
jgi:8-oxo-dGTP pyrophosphatase MutT (NUDIX family)